MRDRDLVCDSGSLISLTSSCLDRLLYFFSENFSLRFIIPPSVEYETVKRPLNENLKRYLFSALKIKHAMEDGIIVTSTADIDHEAQAITRDANNLFFVRGKPLRLIHSGESEMLALAKAIGVKHILIDERTTRMLIESPLELKKHLESEFEVNVMVNRKALTSLSSALAGLNAMRSSELVMLAYENGYFRDFRNLERQAVEAALFQMKYAGCSVSFSEIGSYLSSVR